MANKKKAVKADAVKRVVGLITFTGGIGMLIGILISGWSVGVSLALISLGGYMLFFG